MGNIEKNTLSTLKMNITSGMRLKILLFKLAIPRNDKMSCLDFKKYLFIILLKKILSRSYFEMFICAKNIKPKEFNIIFI